MSKTLDRLSIMHNIFDGDVDWNNLSPHIGTDVLITDNHFLDTGSKMSEEVMFVYLNFSSRFPEGLSRISRNMNCGRFQHLKFKAQKWPLDCQRLLKKCYNFLNRYGTWTKT